MLDEKGQRVDHLRVAPHPVHGIADLRASTFPRDVRHHHQRDILGVHAIHRREAIDGVHHDQ